MAKRKKKRVPSPPGVPPTAGKPVIPDLRPTSVSELDLMRMKVLTETTARQSAQLRVFQMEQGDTAVRMAALQEEMRKTYSLGPFDEVRLADGHIMRR